MVKKEKDGVTYWEFTLDEQEFKEKVNKVFCMDDSDLVDELVMAIIKAKAEIAVNKSSLWREIQSKCGYSENDDDVILSYNHLKEIIVLKDASDAKRNA